MEFTAPNTPKQNGRVEKKIHIIWQRAMTMMNQANLTLDAQKQFWAEAVSTSAFIEDLVIKAGRTSPALQNRTNKPVLKWMKNMVQFGRIGVVHKHGIKGKMKDKGYSAMMVDYAPNNGTGTFRLYNPKTKRIVTSRDVQWMEFKSKQLEAEFELFEPGLKSESDGDESREKAGKEDNASLSTDNSMIKEQES